MKGKRQTITWHVDDLKSSHEDPEVNDEFHTWLNTKYGDEKLGKVCAVREKHHQYFGMILDFSTPRKLKLLYLFSLHRVVILNTTIGND